ncbi:MAG: starch phosphorylase, partial [Pirellulaceae bacterium]
MALALNVSWTWNSDVENLFRELDPIRWRQLDHNPIALLQEYSPERLDLRARELVLHTRIERSHRQLVEYVAAKPFYATTYSGIWSGRPVAYFSAEFGIHESLPIHSSELGILAGDHIKSASDLGVPLVAVGLFYKYGYFRQQLDDSGFQREVYLETLENNLPI